MKTKELPIFKIPEAKEVLQSACRSHKVTLTLLKELIECQRDYLGKGRQMGITAELDTLFAEFLERSDA